MEILGKAIKFCKIRFGSNPAPSMFSSISKKLAIEPVKLTLNYSVIDIIFLKISKGSKIQRENIEFNKLKASRLIWNFICVNKVLDD